jgi:hypothetical protein
MQRTSPKYCGRAHRRPVRCLLWGIASFVAIQSLIALCVATGCLAVHDIVFADKAVLLEQHRAAFQESDDPDKPMAILAMGSSRIVGGLESKRLGELLSQSEGRRTVAFNFGIPAAGPITTNLYLRRLLADGIRPDLVLIEVLPPFLASQLHPPLEAKWLMPHRIRDDEFELLDRWGLHLPREPQTIAGRWLAGVYYYRSALLARHAPAWMPYEQLSDTRSMTDDHGWARAPKDTVTAEQYQKGLSIADKQYAPALLHFSIGRGPAASALRDMLELCRERHLPAVLVLMPEATDFRVWYGEHGLQSIAQHMEELQADFSVPLIDARTWLADEYFADGHHLLPDGARRFTERLAVELRNVPKGPANSRQRCCVVK